MYVAPLDMSGQAWTCIKKGVGVAFRICLFLIGWLLPAKTGQAAGLGSRPGKRPQVWEETAVLASLENGKVANQKWSWGPVPNARAKAGRTLARVWLPALCPHSPRAACFTHGLALALPHNLCFGAYAAGHLTGSSTGWSVLST